MNSLLQERADSITEAVRRVFEMTAFVEFEDSYIIGSDSFKNLPGITVYVDYVYKGKKGSIFLYWSQALADEAASSYIGEEEATSGNIVDALLELSNMVAGNILNRIIGKDEEYDLSVPMIYAKDEAEDRRDPEYAVMFTEFDEKWIVVEIY